MAALRVEFQQLQQEFRNVDPANPVVNVFLDCWQWSLVIAGDPAALNVTLNGIPLDYFAAKPATGQQNINGVFGGFVDAKGEPVNFNSTLRFVCPAPVDLPIVIVKVYHDPNLASPN